MNRFAAAFCAVVIGVSPVRSMAQEGQAAPKADVDIITPHITDAHHIEVPWFRPPFAKEVELPRFLLLTPR